MEGMDRSFGGIAISLGPSSLIKLIDVIQTDVLRQLNLIKTSDFPSSFDTPVAQLSTGRLAYSIIQIAKGSFTPTAVNIDKVIQEPDGHFIISLMFSGNLRFQSWKEQHIEILGNNEHLSKLTFESNQFCAKYDSIAFDFALDIGQNKMNELIFGVVTEVKVKDEPFTYTCKYPNESILNSHNVSCKKINLFITNEISTAVTELRPKLQLIIKTVFDSVNNYKCLLTDNILCLFHGTPQGLVFPISGGVQYRTFSNVLPFHSRFAQRHSYYSEIVSVPFPNIPTDYDAVYNVSAFQFNLLFRAFENAEKLHSEFDDSVVSVELRSAFKTNHYLLSHLLPGLSTKLVFEIKPLKTSNVLVQNNSACYSYDVLVSCWNAGENIKKDVSLFTLQISETENLKCFSVQYDSQSNTHLLKFAVEAQTRGMSCTLKIVSLRYAGMKLKANDFRQYWKLVLHSLYLKTLNKVGSCGILLPCAEHLIITDHEVAVHEGHVSVAVNCASKSRFQNILQIKYPALQETVISNFAF